MDTKHFVTSATTVSNIYDGLELNQILSLMEIIPYSRGKCLIPRTWPRNEQTLVFPHKDKTHR